MSSRAFREQCIHGDLIVHYIAVKLILFGAKAGDHCDESGLSRPCCIQKGIPFFCQILTLGSGQAVHPLLEFHLA
jgi:hypothetical protein